MLNHNIFLLEKVSFQWLIDAVYSRYCLCECVVSGRSEEPSVPIELPQTLPNQLLQSGDHGGFWLPNPHSTLQVLPPKTRYVWGSEKGAGKDGGGVGRMGMNGELVFFCNLFTHFVKI